MRSQNDICVETPVVIRNKISDFLLAFVVSLAISIFIYFILTFMTNLIPFWIPEMAWGANFLFFAVIVEFLSGSVFPLDILPASLTKLLSYTPFPYLVFFPIEIYLGKVDVVSIIKGISISLIWAVALWFCFNSVWKKGLKTYQAYGR